MFHDFGDGISTINVTIEHLLDQIDAILGEWQIWNPQGMVENFIDVVEWVLLVNNSVQENTKSPNILLFSSIRLALKDFRCCIVCKWSVSAR